MQANHGTRMVRVEQRRFRGANLQARAIRVPLSEFLARSRNKENACLQLCP
jgi:hypothetical protein